MQACKAGWTLCPDGKESRKDEACTAGWTVCREGKESGKAADEVGEALCKVGSPSATRALGWYRAEKEGHQGAALP